MSEKMRRGASIWPIGLPSLGLTAPLRPLALKPLAATHDRHRVAAAGGKRDQGEAERARVVGVVAHAPPLVDERAARPRARHEVRFDLRVGGAPRHRAAVLEVLDHLEAAAAQEGLHAALKELEVVAVPHVAVAVDVFDTELVDVEDVRLLLGERVPLLGNQRRIRLHFLWQALVEVVEVGWHISLGGFLSVCLGGAGQRRRRERAHERRADGM
eukprot:scaffold118158_cov60-Phaeocystis_antarctica.AAC.5